MPWKIVNLDYDAEKPHMHLADVRPPGMHMRVFFDKSVEVLIGGGRNIYRCPVQAIVTPDAVTVRAFWFTRQIVQILNHILVSIDVWSADRDKALRWMNEAMQDTPGGGKFLRHPMTLKEPVATDPACWVGNVSDEQCRSLVQNFGWPFDLDDDVLLASMRDPALPKPRHNALFAEARRRGLAGHGGDT